MNYNNPLSFRSSINGELVNYFSAQAFIVDYLKRLREDFPRGYVDLYLFLWANTPYSGNVLAKIAKEAEETLRSRFDNWIDFLPDSHIIKIEGYDSARGMYQADRLLYSLILAITHRRDIAEDFTSTDIVSKAWVEFQRTL